MKCMGKRVLSSIFVFALTAYGNVGMMAQEKQDKNDQKNERLRSRTATEWKNDVEKVGNVLTGAALIESVYVTAPDPTGVTSTALEDNNNSLVKGIQLGGSSAFQFFSLEMSFDNRMVGGAPFSADIVSETIQTLADGTRIVQHIAGRIYRDSQGRTRNERAFRLGEMGEPKQTITIFDPVDGISFTLYPETKAARKAEFSRKVESPPPSTPRISVSPSASANGEPTKKVNAHSEIKQGEALRKVTPTYPQTARAARVSGPVVVQALIGETGEVIEAVAVSGHPLLRGPVVQAARKWVFSPTEVSGKPVKIQGILNFNFMLTNEEIVSPQDAKSDTKYTVNNEQLGKQIIEGVECEGARNVTTLAAGAIGNDRPIESVSETWYSRELKMMILSKRSDPRFGDSIYRVTNIVRAEPEAALFKAPAEYTIRD
jgi:TonB family protein